MYHSITIGEKNTWDDWHLIPASRPTINPPSVNEKIISLPGGNGFLDLTEALTGEPTYGARQGSWQFFVITDTIDWTSIYSIISNYLHGYTRRCVLEDDPGYYYEGRFKVSNWSAGRGMYPTITIDYTLQPFKHHTVTTGEPWQWDPFNFETGKIEEFIDITVSGTLETGIFYSNPGPVVPKIYVSAPMTLSFYSSVDNITISDIQLNAGVNTDSRILIRKGLNSFTFTGNGTVTIDYGEGSL